MIPRRAPLTRRDFVRNSGAALGGLAAASALGAGRVHRDEDVDVRVPRVTLGRTGVEVSRLGIGCAQFQRPRVSPDDVAKTLERALERGVDYLDVAPNYGNDEIGYSEEKMGPALADKAFREQFFLVTKTEEPDRDGTWRLLEQSLKRMRTDRVDLVHLHNLGEPKRWDDLERVFGDNGAMAALREAREQGLVRFIGASGHQHPAQFHRALDSGEIDVLMNAVNFVVQHTYDFEHKIWNRARRDNLGLVAMKVLGGSGPGGAARQDAGFKLPDDKYEEAIRYAFSIPGMHVAVIGMDGIEELEKAARTIANIEPLSEAEFHTLARIGLDLAAEEDWKEVYGTPLT
ncbi:aldo/keto reductase [soil metagenome]